MIQKYGNTEPEKNSDSVIFVHVSGAVNKEGVYELKENSRISDAIEVAGGLRDDADLNEVNLAYKLEDGMKVHIPTKQELLITTDEENVESNSHIIPSGITVENEGKSSGLNINTKVNLQQVNRSCHNNRHKQTYWI